MTGTDFSAAYDARAAAASEQQGTTEIAAALAERGIEAQIEQTGGFCMVAYVRTADGRVLAMANDGRYDLYVYANAEHESEGRFMAEHHLDTVQLLVCAVETVLAHDLYEKCAYCHLFIEPNDEADTYPGLAPYLHMHRGDDADEALDASHEAAPSGLVHSLDAWMILGPPEMVARFDPRESAVVRAPFEDTDELLVEATTAMSTETSPWPWSFQHWGGQNQNGDHSESILFDTHGEEISRGLRDSDGELVLAMQSLLPRLVARVIEQQRVIEARAADPAMHLTWETATDIEGMRSMLRWQGQVSKVALDRDQTKIMVLKDIRAVLADREASPESQVVSIAQVLAAYELADV